VVDTQDLQLAMSPTTEAWPSKDAIAMFVASRARKSGSTYAAVRDKALEIMEKLPTGTLFQRPDHAAEPAVGSTGATTSTAGYVQPSVKMPINRHGCVL
jgi:hypothetical protein